MKNLLLLAFLCILSCYSQGQGLPDSVYVSRNKNKYTFTYQNEQITFKELLAYSRVNDDAYKALFKAEGNKNLGIGFICLGVGFPLMGAFHPDTKDNIEPETIALFGMFGAVLALCGIPLIKSAPAHIDRGITILNSNVMKRTGTLRKPSLEMGLTHSGIGITLHF